MGRAANKLLVLGTGSIAAVKLPDLMARLNQASFQTKLWLTEASRRWADLSAPTLSAASEAEFAQAVDKADEILIAPASASAIARLAHGQGEAARAVLQSGKPVIIVPAMNIRMWQHPATQRNVRRLLQNDVQFLGPVAGDLACGDVGHGRMMEPVDIVAALTVHDFAAPPFRLVQSALRTQLIAASEALPKRLLLLLAGAEREKIPALVHSLKQRGADVAIAVSSDWQTTETSALAELTGHPVYSAHWQHDADGFEHIRLGESVDAALIAPLDATTAHRMALGMSDDFFMATYLACKAPMLAVIAPGTDESDFETLRGDGVLILPRGDELLPQAWSKP